MSRQSRSLLDGHRGNVRASTRRGVVSIYQAVPCYIGGCSWHAVAGQFGMLTERQTALIAQIDAKAWTWLMSSPLL